MVVQEMTVHLTFVLLAGLPDTAENLYQFLLGRVRSKLHVILCQSPVGAQFARRAQQFPGLINGCTIDWFLPWPQQALISVASRAINTLSMACDDTVSPLPRLMFCSNTAAV